MIPTDRGSLRLPRPPGRKREPANAHYHQSLDAMQRSIQRYPEAWRDHYEVELLRLAIEDPDLWWLDTLIFYASLGILASRVDLLMKLAAALPREEALARRAVEEAVGHLKPGARESEAP